MSIHYIKRLMEEDSWKPDVDVINEVKEKTSAYSEYFNYNKPEPDRLTWPTTAILNSRHKKAPLNMAQGNKDKICKIWGQHPTILRCPRKCMLMVTSYFGIG